MIHHEWLWPGFLAFVAAILFFDLFVLHRKDHVISKREALVTVGGYVSLAMLFAAGVFYFAGPTRGAEFLTGYLVEQALSLDNIFVIALIFTYFRVPPEAQYRVLFYGIVGAIVMRLSLIVPGVKIVDQFAVVGMALGGWVSGYIRDLTGSYTAGMLVMMALPVLSVLALIKARPGGMAGPSTIAAETGVV